MPNVECNSAIDAIYQIVSQRKKRSKPSPFFFIVGAGISYPAIPLAGEIEAECRKEAETFGHAAPAQALSKMESYSHWLGKAYPEPMELQDYLRRLMERKATTKANLRLAHLLLDGTVARVVFTPNFDDLLSKALGLLGGRPLVCDHPLTVGRMMIGSSDIQIFHVHGSYWFYDLCNLTHDIEERSANFLMSGMLDQFLREHSPIVVGYSGWEGDIVMQALRRRLSSNSLGTPIYWFCHRKADAKALPGWLTENDQVKVVLPEEAPIAPADPAEASAAGAGAAAAVRSAGGGKFAGSSSSMEEATRSSAAEATLSAERVFESLVRKFALPAPPLTSDPLGFFAEQLIGLLGSFEPGDGDGDIYNFPSVIARVRAARGREGRGDELEEIRDALRRADYRGAITIAGGVALKKLSKEDRKELLDSQMKASLGLFDNSNEELEGYNLAIQIGALLENDGEVEPSVREQVGRALFNKGATLATLNRSEEAIAAYDEVFRRFCRSEEPALREQACKALYNKAATLGGLGRNEQAIAAYTAIVEHYSDSPDLVLQEHVGRALYNKGVALGTLGRSEEAIAAYNEVIRRFSDFPDLVFRERVAKSLLNVDVRLGVLGRHEEALASCDELLRRYSDASEPSLQEQVANALVNKGVRLSELGRPEEEVAAYDEILRRFAGSPDPAFWTQVAKAFLYKGITLKQLNRRAEATVALETLIDRFQRSTDGDLLEPVRRANVLLKSMREEAAGERQESSPE